MKSNIYRLLLAFDTCKSALPEDQRNILNYLSLTELKQIIEPYDKARTRINKLCLTRLDYEAAYNNSLIDSAGSITVHAPRSIEEAALLLTNHDLLDEKRGNLYFNLLSEGQIRIFVGAFSLLIASKPASQGERGHVFDSFGEPAMFEDMLQDEGMKADWATNSDLLKEMILIDPSLPFDMEMQEPEPFQVALTQFPLILAEDRVIPEDLAHLILSNAATRCAVIATHL